MINMITATSICILRCDSSEISMTGIVDNYSDKIKRSCYLQFTIKLSFEQKAVDNAELL